MIWVYFKEKSKFDKNTVLAASFLQQNAVHFLYQKLKIQVR